MTDQDSRLPRAVRVLILASCLLQAVISVTSALTYRRGHSYEIVNRFGAGLGARAALVPPTGGWW